MDAAIIGAGIVGSSIAWRLAQRGLRVILIDAGKLGGEASWAGAGMLAPGGEASEPSPWTSLALESLRLYPAFIDELQRESGSAIDYRRSGAVEVAYTADEWAALRERAATQRDLGISSEPFALESMRIPIVSSGLRGALLYPDDAVVDPRDVTRALRLACLGRGVEIVEGTAVTGLRAGEGGVTVNSAPRSWQVRTAVLAAGAWSGAIPFVEQDRRVELPPTYAVRGHLVGYRLQPGTFGPILRHRHTYILQRASGFTIAGTSTEHVGFERSLDPATIAEIRLRAEALAPPLAVAGEPEAWCGFRPGAANLEPVIGRMPGSHLWLAYGHYRNGILLAPATANRLAEAIIANGETGLPWPGGNR